MHRGPQVPRAARVHHHRVLDGVPVAAGQHRAPRRVRQALGGVGLQHVDPPVLGARRRAAHVQPPPALGRVDQRGPLQRLGTEPVFGHLRDGLEPHAVGAARHDVRHAPALPQRGPHPVGEVVDAVDEQRAGGARPEAGAQPGAETATAASVTRGTGRTGRSSGVIAEAVMWRALLHERWGGARPRAARAVDGRDPIAAPAGHEASEVRAVRKTGTGRSGPTGRAREVPEVDVAAPGQHVALSDDLGPGHATHGRRRNRCGQPHPRVDGRGGPPLPSAQGHECQRQAPARWSATLLRGGVLRVTTWPSRQPRRQARTVAGPGVREGPCDDAHPRPPRPRRTASTLPRPVGAGTRVPLVTGGTAEYANLDLAASAPALEPVAAHVADVLPLLSSVHRGAGYLSQVSTALLERARECVGEFVGARA